MFNKKYTLTKETMVGNNGVKVYRIKATKDFGSVKKGDLGGFVESEENLSHFGKCWIADNAVACGSARVKNNAMVKDNAVVSDGAWVIGNAKVYGNAFIYDEAEVAGHSHVYGNAEVCGFETEVCGRARVHGNAKVCDGLIRGEAHVHGNAIVYDNIEVAGDAEIIDDIMKYI